MTDAQFEAQALSALRMARGAWHCPRCWGAVAGLASPQDVAGLGQLARTLIEMSPFYERAMTDQERAPACIRAGAAACDFAGDGRKRQTPNTWTWVVRAKPMSDLG